MRKVIKVSELSLEKKVSLMSLIAGINTNETEVKVISELILQSSGGVVTMSAETHRQISQILNIKKSYLVICMLRLSEKKAISRDGKNVILNPIYSGLNEVTEVLIKA